jgi:phenylpropionate dioxygenase-like ring-hydroxylating dioxygenase large terminal subunit
MHTIFAIARGDRDDTDRALLEERVANEGFRGRWYALTASRNVGTEPHHVRRMGEPLVLWRDGAGTLHVQEDRCPHRGARLSQGFVHADTIVCPYHGVRIDAAGAIAAVPALPGCPLEGRSAVRTYVAREHGGVIFAYFPSPTQPDPVAFEPPEELDHPEWSHFVCEATWKCNYRYAVENVMDPMHGPYLHGTSHTMQYGSKEDVMDITESATGYRISRRLQQGVSFDWTEFGDTGIMWMKLDIPYPVRNGPGGPFRVVGFATPIDEHTTHVFFLRLRRTAGWQRDLWRFLYRDRLEKRHWDVLEQDRIVLEGMPDDAREHEMLYQHDVGITRLRRRLKALAREQIEAARGAVPA